MKISLKVIFRIPHNVSCTIPMTGLLDCGDTIWRGTAQICDNSDLVSGDWGTCKFISSPSKSALYGEVTDKFNLNVEYGITFTLCAIIDILCNDGWRLNKTGSSSIKWRSTFHPYCKAMSPALLLYLKSIRSPVSLITYFAPGCSFGPFLTNSVNLWMLYGVTISG